MTRGVKAIESIEFFAQTIHDLLHSDRDVVVATGGFTGEGKSTFVIQLNKAYAKIQGIPFTFEKMTWARKEMLKWIDGEGPTKEGQLPEYDYIIADELFRMFYGRTWFDEGQIDALATFNACRDRHLLVSGNVPQFWDLDSGFRSRVRFYVYIPERGVAWIFHKENNPFSKDPWNVSENTKIFRKNKGNPYGCPNFVCEIHFDELDPDQQAEYLEIRNTKRVHMNDESKEKQERYSSIVRQRDAYIRALISASETLERNDIKGLTQREIADMGGVSDALISMIKNGVR